MDKTEDFLRDPPMEKLHFLAVYIKVVGRQALTHATVDICANLMRSVKQGEVILDGDPVCGHGLSHPRYAQLGLVDLQSPLLVICP